MGADRVLCFLTVVNCRTSDSKNSRADTAVIIRARREHFCPGRGGHCNSPSPLSNVGFWAVNFFLFFVSDCQMALISSKKKSPPFLHNDREIIIDSHILFVFSRYKIKSLRNRIQSGPAGVRNDFMVSRGPSWPRWVQNFGR